MGNDIRGVLVHYAEYTDDPALALLKKDGLIEDCPKCTGHTGLSAYSYCKHCDDTGFVPKGQRGR